MNRTPFIPTRMGNYGYKTYNIMSSLAGEYFDDKDTEILYVGRYGTSGYALACCGYIFDMVLSGYNVSWAPILIDRELSGIQVNHDSYFFISRLTINKKNNPSVLIIHETPGGIREGEIVNNWEWYYNVYNTKDIEKVIGFTVWETEDLPESWIDMMNADYIDEIWTPSEYNKRVFKKSGINKNIKVIPHIWLGKTLPIVKKSDNYVFYNISEFTERKGIFDLIETFCEEFNKDDKVELVFKTHYNDYSEKNIKFINQSCRKIIDKYDNIPNIKLILKHLTEKEILELHAYGDCYYTPCRSEGFGLPIYDAHMYNNSVVATGYGGHVDFLGKNYHGLIDYKMGKVKNMEDFAGGLYNDHIWAYPDKNHARKLLRNEYEKWLSEK